MLRTVFIFIGIGWAAGWAANLHLTGQSNQTYENQTYEHLWISGSSNITIRNCTFRCAYQADTSAVAYIVNGSHHITLQNCEIDGMGSACTGARIYSGVHDITLQGCHIHNIADDGVEVSGENLFFYDNVIHALYGCGTDNGCGPCHNGHSDGIELAWATNAVFKRNLIYDVRSTSAFYMDDTGGKCYNVVLENNIFYTPESGFTAYFISVWGMQVYNNIFWDGIYGGVSICTGVHGLEMRNNIVQSVNYFHCKDVYDSTEHHYGYNLVAMPVDGLPLQAHDVWSVNPKFKKIPHAYDTTRYREVTIADFELQANSPAIDKGIADTNAPTDDIYGAARIGTMDIGPFSRQATKISASGCEPVAIRSGIEMRHGVLLLYDPLFALYPATIHDTAGNCLAGSPRRLLGQQCDMRAWPDGVYFIYIWDYGKPTALKFVKSE